MSTGIIILSADESTHHGTPTPLLPFRGTTLLQHSIDAAHLLPRAPIVVVLGAHSGRIRTELSEPFLLMEENPDWEEGIGTSIRSGLRVMMAAHPTISAVILLHCDQPLLSPNILSDLAETHDRTKRPIVASENGGALGLPALFASSLFPELLALDGVHGARRVIRAHRDDAVGVGFSGLGADRELPAHFARLSDSLLEHPARIPA